MARPPCIISPGRILKPLFSGATATVRGRQIFISATQWHASCSCRVVMIPVLCFLAAFLVPLDHHAAEPDAAMIVRRSVEANLRNYEALPRFDYFKVERRPDGTSRTFEEIMLFGSRYSRLTAVNGEALSQERERDEKQKLERVVKSRAGESPADRTRRVAGYQQERQRDQLLLNEMGNAFDFTMSGEQLLEGHEVYILKARPRRGYKPPNNRAKVLTGMEGTLWIEKNTFQWARVEARVMRPVSIEGFLARVEPGTRLELKHAPLSGDLWMPAHFSMKARATILFLFSKADEEDESYYGYHPAADR